MCYSYISVYKALDLKQTWIKNSCWLLLFEHHYMRYLLDLFNGSSDLRGSVGSYRSPGNTKSQPWDYVNLQHTPRTLIINNISSTWNWFLIGLIKENNSIAMYSYAISLFYYLLFPKTNFDNLKPKIQLLKRNDQLFFKYYLILA